jgi:hypothetical protein
LSRYSTFPVAEEVKLIKFNPEMNISQSLTINRITLLLSHLATPTLQNNYRWSVASILDRITLYPEIPPQAIVIVRYLSDPLPGELLSADPGHDIRPWEQKAQAQIDGCWRTAIRAADSMVPAAANAVWFVDMAEWLACLSWDVHQGVASQRWWWQTWLRNYTLAGQAETLFRLWQSEVQWLPQTLTLLQRRHGLGVPSLLARLSAGQTRTLRQWVAEAYSLPEVNSAHQLVHILDPLPSTDPIALVQALPTETQALLLLCLAIVQTPTRLQLLKTAVVRGETDAVVSEADIDNTHALNHVVGETDAVVSEADIDNTHALNHVVELDREHGHRQRLQRSTHQQEMFPYRRTLFRRMVKSRHSQLSLSRTRESWPSTIREWTLKSYHHF